MQPRIGGRRHLGACLAWLLPALPFIAAVPAIAQQQQHENEAPILFSADELQNDEELGLIVAKGKVQITQGQRTVLADTVSYNQRTDTITASGHVSLQEPTGEVLFADYMEMSNHFDEGFLHDIRALLSDRSRLAGNTARRTGGNRLELRRGLYSPCDLCEDDPESPPLWQLRAQRIIHDQDTHLIEYRNVVIELGGIPILYTPYLSHPDPTVKRRSGFMPPTIGNSTNLGFHATLPYFWAIGPDRDATFSPIFTSNSGQVMAGEYRQRFSDGELDLRGSVNYDSSTQAPRNLLRGHLKGIGRWDLDENWRAGFDIARSTDQTYLRRFAFGGTESFLDSRAYTEAFTQRSFFSANGYAFQSLRQGTNDSMQPIVLPVLQYSWLGRPADYGGRWNFDANVLNLTRQRGTGTHRLSLATGWDLPFFGPIGDVYSISATLRGDSYYATDFQPFLGQPARDSFAGRVFPQIALNWRYPWVRRGDHFSQTIEPVVAVIAGPRGGNPITIPNEDSLSFDFDETDLFVPNRFPGLDRVDGGQRVDYGLRASIYGDKGGSSRILIGQSYRLQRENVFAAGSGLEKQLSDVVGRIVVSPSSYFDAIYRFRFASSDLRSERQEIGFSGGFDALRVGASYITLPPDPLSSEIGRRDEVAIAVTATVTRYWGLQLATTQSLTGALGNVSSAVAATYRDECFSFVASVGRTGTRDRDVKPGTSLLFTFVFKNLGDIAAPAFSGG